MHTIGLAVGSGCPGELHLSKASYKLDASKSVCTREDTKRMDLPNQKLTSQLPSNNNNDNTTSPSTPSHWYPKRHSERTQKRASRAQKASRKVESWQGKAKNRASERRRRKLERKMWDRVAIDRQTHTNVTSASERSRASQRAMGAWFWFSQHRGFMRSLRETHKKYASSFLPLEKLMSTSHRDKKSLFHCHYHR